MQNGHWLTPCIRYSVKLHDPNKRKTLYNSNFVSKFNVVPLDGRTLITEGMMESSSCMKEYYYKYVPILLVLLRNYSIELAGCATIQEQ